MYAYIYTCVLFHITHNAGLAECGARSNHLLGKNARAYQKDGAEFQEGAVQPEVDRSARSGGRKPRSSSFHAHKIGNWLSDNAPR